MHYFKLQKFEFKQLIDDMTINFQPLFGKREWNDMERNEKNNFRIFFTFSYLGVLIEEMEWV